MDRIYLDNAATTPLDPRVAEAMMTVLKDVFGNPSATHAIGRQAKGILESSRNKVASLLHAKPSEIIFTSGGTEADNMALRCAVNNMGIQTIITSAIEHKAVLDTALDLKKKGVTVLFVQLNSDGSANTESLNDLCASNPGSLVSLMHANNEIGTLNNLSEIADICHKHNCIFHSDTVQTVGHYKIDVEHTGVDMLSCSAHKFNGPKGTGFLYLNSRLKTGSLITGGGQERNHRAGTENMAGIVGLAKALEIACDEMEVQQQQIGHLKKMMQTLLEERIEGVSFNGNTKSDKSLYTVLNASLPPHPLNEMLLFRLDLEGLCVSGGSACNSGAAKGSHVLAALGHPDDRMAIRFSFGKYTTDVDIINAVNILSSVLYSTQPIG